MPHILTAEIGNGSSRLIPTDSQRLMTRVSALTFDIPLVNGALKASDVYFARLHGVIDLDVNGSGAFSEPPLINLGMFENVNGTWTIRAQEAPTVTLAGGRAVFDLLLNFSLKNDRTTAAWCNVGLSVETPQSSTGIRYGTAYNAGTNDQTGNGQNGEFRIHIFRAS